MGWFEDGGSGSQADVAAIMDSQCADHVWAIVQHGAMVSFGTTSDGGSLGVTVTLDGRWKRTYQRSSEELAPWLADALSAVAEEARRPTAPSAPRTRSKKAG